MSSLTLFAFVGCTDDLLTGEPYPLCSTLRQAIRGKIGQDPTPKNPTFGPIATMACSTADQDQQVFASSRSATKSRCSTKMAGGKHHGGACCWEVCYLLPELQGADCVWGIGVEDVVVSKSRKFLRWLLLNLMNSCMVPVLQLTLSMSL
ncbi:hypothetical protein LINPERPRIM_LOCUS38919 [Linum perenne]